MCSEFVKDVAEGATKGALKWSEDFIKRIAVKFRDKKLAFIRDEETIKIVKEQYRSGELAVYKEYISDKEMLFLLKMGLTLRRIEKEGNQERKQKLRGRIFDEYKVKGLHIAQFVENGILNRYIGILIENISSLSRFKLEIKNILENIEKHVLFVKNTDRAGEVIKVAVQIVNAHQSSIFIVSGISSAAEIVKNCENKLLEYLIDYNLEKISGGGKENLFFKRILTEN